MKAGGRIRDARTPTGPARSVKRGNGHAPPAPPRREQSHASRRAPIASVPARQHEPTTSGLRPEVQKFVSELADLLVEDLVRFPRQK
jgi:hypothetical protein